MNYIVDRKKKILPRAAIRFPPEEFVGVISPVLEKFGGPHLCGERLVRWFVQQDPLVQSAVQGLVPVTEDVANLIIKRLLEQS